jgi:serine/threonine protein kinase
MASGESSCPRCGTAIASAARFCPSCGYAAARLAPGQTLDGKYEILDKIGEGGMGEVFRARHIHLDEIRIIKVTKPDPLGEGSEPRRFQEEARIATLVRHPNVAALYDFSRLPDGSYYMVWEFIDGITVENWLKRYGPLPAARALEVAAQVLAGLGEIHAQGIVHRDLSPDNIMLRELPGGRLQAKIIDLGIAKRVAAESLQMTGTGMFLGKLKYCSPEQAGSLPRGQTVDGRSDLYSFGVVLFEMLSGHPPFESQTPEGYLGMHLHQPPPPLDTTRVPPRIAPALASIVTKALEKPREKRFKDAREFAEALSKLTPQVTQPAEMQEGMPTIEMRTGPRRVRTAWTIGALVAVAALAALWTIARREKPAEPAPILTVTPVSSPAPPTPRPTESIDEMTVPAPRVIEGSQTQIGVPHPQATRQADSHPSPSLTAAPPTRIPTQVPAAVPTPLPAAQPTPRTADWNDPQKARQRLSHWLSRPAEERAHAAIQVSKWANKMATEYPDDANVKQMKHDLPALFRGETIGALDNRQPFLANLFYRAYLGLDFAPPDPDLARRMKAAAQQYKRQSR